jgi:hypothetical protein
LLLTCLKEKFLRWKYGFMLDILYAVSLIFIVTLLYSFIIQHTYWFQDVFSKIIWQHSLNVISSATDLQIPKNDTYYHSQKHHIVKKVS